MKDFVSATSILSGELFIDDDSPPEGVLIDLLDLAGDDFDGLAVDGVFFVGDFLVFDGESF